MSFENGQWNGLWTEDSQNDWFTSSQRATTGNYSAEVDGRATNATLSVASPIDLSGFDTASLSFDWLIESGFDSGEYLALDFKAANGAWNEILRLDGNSDPENQWHQEFVGLDSEYRHDQFAFRFRAYVSRYNEDANVDNVKLVAANELTEPNVAPVATGESFSVDEDQTLVVTSPGLLSNDSDSDGDPLISQLVTAPAHGSLALNPDGSFVYQPDPNFYGLDSFTYVAYDGTDTSNVAQVNLNVIAVNDAPTLGDDNYATDEDAVLTVNAAAGLLANDADVDGDSLTAVLVAGPTNGSLTLNPDGSFEYTPNPGFYGSDSFSYLANDGTVDSASANVALTVNRVNQLPVSLDDYYQVDEDTPLVVGVAGILGNDSDGDADPLTAVLQSGPSHGSLTLNPDGSFDYIPDANYSGTDSFTYVADDGFGQGNIATVAITVNPVNDAPVAGADSYSVDQAATLSITAPGLLANDNDLEGDSLTAVLMGGPANGSLTLNSDGSFNYTPDTGFTGNDSFTYRANDGQLDSGDTTVSITVNAVASGPKLAFGDVVSNGGWQTVTLPSSYDAMVVVATPNYDKNDVPAVVRIRNTGGNSFEFAVQRATNSSSPTYVSGVPVHYTVMEEGVYDNPEEGYRLEVVTFDSTSTDRRSSWNGQSVRLPAVLQQPGGGRPGDELQRFRLVGILGLGVQSYVDPQFQ